jgi:hypothetical protein
VAEARTWPTQDLEGLASLLKDPQIVDYETINGTGA